MSGSVLEFFVLVGAAFMAGVVNTIAGGGSILTFPALLFAGVPPISASATSALVVLPGYLGGALGFRRELAALGRGALLKFVLIAAAGGVVGAQLLLITPAESFILIVPCLILFATALFAFSAPLQKWLGRRDRPVAGMETGALLAVSTYGGFFNGGLGILLMAVLALRKDFTLAATNAVKSAMSFPLTLVSVITFILAGVIEWAPAFAMMLAALIGGYSGSYVTRAVPAPVLKTVVTLIGFGIGMLFLYDAFAG